MLEVRLLDQKPTLEKEGDRYVLYFDCPHCEERLWVRIGPELLVSPIVRRVVSGAVFAESGVQVSFEELSVEPSINMAFHGHWILTGGVLYEV